MAYIPLDIIDTMGDSKDFKDPKSRFDKTGRTTRVRQLPSTWSFRKTIRNSATHERIYLGVGESTCSLQSILFESVVVTALAMGAWALMVSRLPPSNKQSMSLSVYMAIFVLARLFSLAYCLDAIRARNVVQLLMHIIFQFCMLAYAAILEIPQIHSAFKSLDDVRGCMPIDGGAWDCLARGSLFYTLRNILIWPCVICGLATAAYCYLARRLYIQFGWEECRILNASLQMKRMYRTYAAMVSLLKMLAFFAGAFCMAYIVLITSLWKDKVELAITVAALPVFYPTILLSGWALIHEDVVLMVVSLVLLLAGEAYFVYKMASLWLPRTAQLYTNTRITLAVFSAFSVILLLAVLINGCLCLSNFGKGLISAHVQRRRKAAMSFMPCVGRKSDEDPEEIAVQPLVIE